MHDMAVALDHHLLGNLDRADLGDAADIVAREIQEHQMLGALLGIGEQLRGELGVLGRGRAAPARAGERADGDFAVAQAHQHFRARSHHREAAVIEEEQEGRGVEAPERAIEREGRQAERHAQPHRRHDLEDLAGADVLLRRLDHRHAIGARHVGLGRRQLLHRLRRLAPVRQAALEIAEHVAEPLARAVIGRGRGEAGFRPYRRHHGDAVGDVVEDAHDRGPQQHPVGDRERVRVFVGQALHQGDHVVAEIAEQPRRHRRQRLRRRDAALGDQGAQRGERAAGDGLERCRVRARLAVHLGAVAEAAPDQVGLEADEGIAPARGAAFDRFEEEAVGPPIRQLEHGRDRRLEIGDQRRPYQHRPAVGVALSEIREAGGELHRARPRRRGRGRLDRRSPDSARASPGRTAAADPRARTA